MVMTPFQRYGLFGVVVALIGLILPVAYPWGGFYVASFVLLFFAAPLLIFGGMIRKEHKGATDSKEETKCQQH